MMKCIRHSAATATRACAARLAPLVAATTVSAGSPEPAPPGARPDKSAYHLFNPVPAALLRDLSADRPDQTESAYTVDAGHFQVEMDLVNLFLDEDRSGGGDQRTEIWAVAPTNLKLGLWNRADLQLVLDPFVHARVEDRAAGTVSEASGFGNVQTRLKYNLWGNDGGPTALAVMPFVKWPLPESGLRNGHVEGGVILPFAAELPQGWGLGLMTEFDWVRRQEASTYDTWFVNSVTLGRNLGGRLGGYVEFFTVVSAAGEFDWVGQVGGGLTYALNANLRLDLGCNFGVTDSAPDFNPFVGLTWRH